LPISIFASCINACASDVLSALLRSAIILFARVNRVFTEGNSNFPAFGGGATGFACSTNRFLISRAGVRSRNAFVSAFNSRSFFVLKTSPRAPLSFPTICCFASSGTLPFSLCAAITESTCSKGFMRMSSMTASTAIVGLCHASSRVGAFSTICFPRPTSRRVISPRGACFVTSAGGGSATSAPSFWRKSKRL